MEILIERDFDRRYGKGNWTLTEEKLNESGEYDVTVKVMLPNDPSSPTPTNVALEVRKPKRIKEELVRCSVQRMVRRPRVKTHPFYFDLQKSMKPLLLRDVGLYRLRMNLLVFANQPAST